MPSRSRKEFVWWCTFLLFLSLAVYADLTQAFGPYSNVQILEVKDGDTVEVMVEVYPDTYIQTDVRVHGIDTPETRRGVKNGNRIPECELVLGETSKVYAKKLLSEASKVHLFQVDPKKTKYAGRISGDFILSSNLALVTVGEASPKLFSEEMIKAGHAVEYNGGTRDIWPCGEKE